MVRGLKALAAGRTALPPTSTAPLAGGTVEYVRAGEGSPAVVLVGGFGLPIEAWALVLPPLAETTRVLAYNRSGVGASAMPRQPETAAAVVGQLRALLAAAGVAPPHVLVAHGPGGLHVNLFARSFPHEVAGVVLLESMHPDDDVDDRRFRFLPAFKGRTGSRKGAWRHGELHFLVETAAEIAHAGPFPDVPLTVVSGSRTPPRWTTSPQQVRTRAARQLQLVGLSALGTHAVAPASGAFPQITDPEIVVRAVRELVVA